ncbi:sensory box histidine kinase/response regulator [Plesiocystis pacifica SIR-1]|uniref:histidine kinase n=2 Tax=Plesiocystis pacifica TaxID=191768 RepID=A6GAG2_9BACT|nr:sensory box histidine kinase/response regulator [Plesiocystis pacifica SIR-1]
MFEATSSAMFVYSLEGRLVDINPAACALHGWSREQMLDMSPHDFIAPESIDVFDAFRAALARGEEYWGEAQGLRADGGRFDVAVYGVGIELDGETYACSSLTDITEKVRLREKLAESQRMDALGRLAGGIAHDFNNMLSVVMCSAELGQLASDPAAVEAAFEDILAAASRARDLTTQLLSFSRSRAIRRQLVDLRELAVRVLPLIERLLPKAITMKSVFGDEPLLVEGEASPLEQILVNLVLNARDALPEGGHIAVEMRRRALEGWESQHGLSPGAYVEVLVEDDGIGMDAATRARIFEPFFTTKGCGGTGLGLASAYGIVKQHGGEIVVYSEPGCGTSFRVFLPCRDESQALSKLEAERPPPEADFTTLDVVIVDDDPLVGGVVTRTVESLGANAVLAEVANAAELVGQSGATLLITDVIMPGQTGTQLYASLLKDYPELRVLYLSGYSAEHLMRGGLLDADIEVLSKPFCASELAVAICRALAH